VPAQGLTLTRLTRSRALSRLGPLPMPGGRGEHRTNPVNREATAPDSPAAPAGALFPVPTAPAPHPRPSAAGTALLPAGGAWGPSTEACGADLIAANTAWHHLKHAKVEPEAAPAQAPRYAPADVPRENDETPSGRSGFVLGLRWLPGTPAQRTDRQTPSGQTLSFWITREQRSQRVSRAEGGAKRRRSAPRARGSFAPRDGQGVLEVAQGWYARIGLQGVWTKADLAVAMGLSRARVSQVLSVLDADPSVLERLMAWESEGRPVTERAWRLARGRSAAGVLRALARMGWV
jgi:hypothetical protein